MAPGRPQEPSERPREAGCGTAQSGVYIQRMMAIFFCSRRTSIDRLKQITK